MNKNDKDTFTRRIINSTLGNAIDFSLEHRFFNSISLIAIIVSVISFTANLILELGPAQVLFTLAGIIIFGSLYYFSRVKKKSKYLVLIFFLVTTGILTNMWFVNSGLSGPIPFVLFLVITGIIIVLKGNQRIFMLIFSAVQLIGLIIVEYLHPELITLYESISVQYIDMGISLFYSLFLVGVFIAIIMKNFNDYRLRAEESDKLKSNFLANMSHEIRTPLNGIIGFAELLSEPGLSIEKRKEYFEIIDQNSEHLLNLINDIIDLSKIETGFMKVDYHNVNINYLMDEIASFFKPEVEKESLGNVEIRTNYLLKDDFIITTASVRLKQILMNLVKNAIKFTKTGYIEIGYLIEKETTVVFYVKDTGVGLSPNQQKYIFDRFMQADNSEAVRESGAGLGLSITKSFVELLGGKIWIESSPENGSTFYFTLPLKVNK
ncbi:MAG: ATP-binding protein [Bacteroidota bacterium]